MCWLSGKPIDSQLGGARFKSLLSLLVYMYKYLFIYLSIYLSVASCRLPSDRRLLDVGYRSVASCRISVAGSRLPFGCRWLTDSVAGCH